MSIRKLILTILLVSSFISVLLISSLWLFEEFKGVNRDIVELRTSSLNEQKKQLRSEVQRVKDYIHFKINYSKEIPDSIIQKEILKYITTIRFGNDGYVFVNTFSGNALVFDGQLVSGNKSIKNLTDPNGLRIFDMELRAAQKIDGDFIEYYFKKMTDTIPQAKISFIGSYNDWQWIIGAGDYYDNLEAQIAKLENDVLHKNKLKIYKILLNFLILVVLLIIYGIWISKEIKKQYQTFVDYIKGIIHHERKGFLDKIFIKEFKNIGIDLKIAHERAKQFADIINQSLNEIYIFDAKTLKFLYLNKEALKNIGYSQHEITQLSALQIKPEMNADKFNSILNSLRTGEKSKVIYETIHQRKNKTLYPVEVNLQLMRFDDKDAFVAMILDISFRKEIERNLSESEERFRRIFEETTAIMFIIDSESGKFLDANPAAVKYYGYSKTDFIEKLHFQELIIDEGSRFDDAVKSVLSGEKGYFNFKHKHKNGEIRDVELYGGQLVLKERKVIFSIVQDITERKKAEEDIKVLAHALRSINDCVTVTDLNNNLLFVNDAFLKTYGYNLSDVIGNKINVFASEKNPENIHEQILAETKNGGWKGELWNTRKDGSEFKIFLSTSIIKDENDQIVALVGVSNDITEQNRAELLREIIYNISQAANTEIYLDQLIEIIKNQLEQVIEIKNFYVAFYDKDEDRFTSPFMLDEKDDFESWPAGKSISAFVIKNRKPILLNKEDIIKLREKGELEVVGTLPEIWMGVPLIVKGKPYGIFAIQHYENPNAYTKDDLDMLEFVSHQMSISIERKRAEIDLIKAKEKAEESDRLKSAFLATMSHELRTPLNAIIGFSELIKDKLTKEKIIEFAGIINRSGVHLLEIVEDIFDVTLLEVGQVHVLKAKHSLKSLMTSIREMAEAEQAKINSNVEIIYKPTPDEDEIILVTDKSKFKQIITNLLKNALKFTHEGYIEYGFEKIVEQGVSLLRFYVKDTGIGIPKEKQEDIFKIFRQVDETLTRSYGGAGIGLFVVKRFTDILGGKINLISEPGKGSTFYISFPYEDPKSEKDNLSKISDVAINLSNKTVLIVEDDLVSTELLMVLLDELKANYLIANNGKEAVRFCAENENIDIVLMDIKMPEMDGYEATRLIKKIRPKIKIIAQTAHAIQSDRQDALKAGCDNYISKPIMKEKLISVLRHELNA